MKNIGFWGWLGIGILIFVLVRGFDIGNFFTSFF